MTDRTHQPPIRKPEHMVLHRPERVVWPNGVPLSVLRAGDNEVVRIDVLMEGGRWHQRYPLQALFANRMLREGTRRYTAAQIAERWITTARGSTFRAVPSMPSSPSIRSTSTCPRRSTCSRAS